MDDDEKARERERERGREEGAALISIDAVRREEKGRGQRVASRSCSRGGRPASGRKASVNGGARNREPRCGTLPRVAARQSPLGPLLATLSPSSKKLETEGEGQRERGKETGDGRRVSGYRACAGDEEASCWWCRRCGHGVLQTVRRDITRLSEASRTRGRAGGRVGGGQATGKDVDAPPVVGFGG